MAYDIYGNHLRPGHCEVHPDVRHEYPCQCCVDDYRASHEPNIEPNIEPDIEPSDEDVCSHNHHPYYIGAQMLADEVVALRAENERLQARVDDLVRNQGDMTAGEAIEYVQQRWPDLPPPSADFLCDEEEDNAIDALRAFVRELVGDGGPLCIDRTAAAGIRYCQCLGCAASNLDASQILHWPDCRRQRALALLGDSDGALSTAESLLRACVDAENRYSRALGDGENGDQHEQHAAWLAVEAANLAATRYLTKRARAKGGEQ